MTTTTEPATKSSSIPVHIVMVLDESGSMSNLRDDLIGGVNAFLDEQRAAPGKCRLTLVKFDPFVVIHDAVKIADVPNLTHADYQPRSNTPLLDAEGRAITAAVARAEARKTAGKKDEAVLFVTYTDGEENASREWSWQALADLKAEREKAGWTFLYLGVGHDAYGQSRHLGTRMQNTSSTVRTAKGVRSAFAASSDVTRAYRGAAAAGDSATLVAASANAYGAFNVAKADDDAALAEQPTVTSTTSTR